MVRILALDPSGTGTTGICLIEDQKISFQQYQNPEWEVHLNFLISLIETYKPTIILYENTHYIHEKTKDGLSLFRLLGAIEGLTYTFPPIQSIESVLVSQVKDLKKQLFKGIKKIPEIEFKVGIGWLFKGQKVSLHQLDAFLVYYLWKEAQHA